MSDEWSVFTSHVRRKGLLRVSSVDSWVLSYSSQNTKSGVRNPGVPETTRLNVLEPDLRLTEEDDPCPVDLIGPYTWSETRLRVSS